MNTKNQHIIPVVYLKYFSPNPNEKRGKRKILSVNLNKPIYKIEQKRLEKVAAKKHFYSIKKNKQQKRQQQYDYFVEENLSLYENDWGKVVDKIVYLINGMTLFGEVQTFQNLELYTELKKSISIFFWRAEARRIEIERFFEHKTESIDKNGLEELVSIHHLREMGLMAGRTFLSLCRKKVSIFFSKTPIFVTSDNPVIVMNNNPDSRSDILNPKSIIYCAVTPEIAVIISPNNKYKPYSIDNLEKIINVSNAGNIENVISNVSKPCDTIELRLADCSQKSIQNRLVTIETNDWLFSNNHNSLKECLHIMPERAKERPKITNYASIFVRSRVNFFNECLKATTQKGD